MLRCRAAWAVWVVWATWASNRLRTPALAGVHPERNRDAVCVTERVIPNGMALFLWKTVKAVHFHGLRLGILTVLGQLAIKFRGSQAEMATEHRRERALT